MDLKKGKHQVSMSTLDRLVIEKSSNNIKKLLKKIDRNSEQFLKWIAQKEIEDKLNKNSVSPNKVRRKSEGNKAKKV